MIYCKWIMYILVKIAIYRVVFCFKGHNVIVVKFTHYHQKFSCWWLWILLWIDYQCTIHSHSDVKRCWMCMAVIHQSACWCCSDIVEIGLIWHNLWMNPIIGVVMITMEVYCVRDGCLVDEFDRYIISFCESKWWSRHRSIKCPGFDNLSWSDFKFCILRY